MERINKFLAHAGVGSRRHCDDLVAGGRVKVNGYRVTDLGARVDPETQKVTVDDVPVRAERPVYWVVHKPPGYLCTNSDPAGRPLALDLIPHVDQRVYTVGRLDEASEGLLLMTNDGELAHALTHPRFAIDKTYLVQVAGKPSRDDFQKLVDGVWLSDGKVRAKDVRRMKPQGDSTWVRIVLNEGKNREIRRMLAQLGHKVVRLKRVAIGPVDLDKLPKGKARRLSLAELTELKKAVAGGVKRVEKKAELARTGEVPAVDGKPVRPRPPKGKVIRLSSAQLRELKKGVDGGVKRVEKAGQAPPRPPKGKSRRPVVAGKPARSPGGRPPREKPAGPTNKATRGASRRATDQPPARPRRDG